MATKTLLVTLFIVLLVPVACGTVFYWAVKRPDHFSDPILRYLRDGKNNLIPDVFTKGAPRSAAIAQLQLSGFEPVEGTVFQYSTRAGQEKWFRREEHLVLWHFTVELRFDTGGNLVDAVGNAAGPILE